MKNPAIELKNVTKIFTINQEKTIKEFLPAFLVRKSRAQIIEALKNVSFTVPAGESFGIIGRNGAGKSTILKLIAQVSSPTKGKIVIKGKVSPLIELGAGFHPELTGRENIYLNAAILGLSRKEIRRRFGDIVDFAELWDFIDTPIKYYSSGMYARLGFSVAISVDPEILLIDEILAVGDTAFQEKCLEKMEEFKKGGVTIVFVSHGLGTVANFCQRAIWIDRGEIRADGPAQEVVNQYQQSLSSS